MASKFTKVTQPNSIGGPFSRRDQRHFTEKPSAGSKNLSSANIGFESESKVVDDLKAKKCRILGQRIRTPFAEVDILFRSAQGQIVLLEVKSLTRWAWLETRLTRKQTERLKRAALYFSHKMNEPIQLCAAFVKQDKIYYFAIEEE